MAQMELGESTAFEVEAIPDLKYWCKGMPSNVGKRVAKLLADWAGGAHHLPAEIMKKADWENPRFVVINADSAMTGGLSTVDWDGLTALVFLAHDHCIRVEIQAKGTQTLRLLFHPRQREGGFSQRHPTLEQAVESWRKRHPHPDAQPATGNSQPATPGES